MKRTRLFDFYPLEDRVLLSGEGADCVPDADGADPSISAALLADIEPDGYVVECPSVTVTELTGSAQDGPSDKELAQAPTLDPAIPLEVVFIDSRVEDADTLLNGLRNNAAQQTQWIVVELDAGEDGINQISETLGRLSGVDAVHLVSHGDGESIQLGATRLDADSSAGSAGQIALWGDCMDTDADLLVYGCDLASTPDGRALIGSLSALIDCDVAASDDDTGHSELGGDWDLEYTVGTIDTEIAFESVARNDWMHSLDAASRGVAIWSDGSSSNPEYRDWDGTGFNMQLTADTTSQYEVIDGADSKATDERIIVGVDSSGRISGQIWDGSTWMAFAFSMDNVSSGSAHGFDVQYESISNDAMLVWNNGSNGSSSISYRVWNGSSWSGEQVVATPLATCF